MERFKDEMQAAPRQKKSEPADNPPAPAKVIEQNFPPNVYVPDRGIWQKFFSVKGRLNPMRFIFRMTLAYFVTILFGLLCASLPLPVEVKNAVFSIFHMNITQKSYRNAYNLLIYDFQYEMNYEGWAAGFNTNVSSSVSKISVVNESPAEISLNYILGRKFFP